MFTVMTNIENRCDKIFIIHYFDTDPLGTGFKSLSQADWLFFSENELKYVKTSSIRSKENKRLAQLVIFLELVFVFCYLRLVIPLDFSRY